jgi:predicted nucleotidyltransferase
MIRSFFDPLVEQNPGKLRARPIFNLNAGKVEGVDAVHLYGSVARGEASLTSDFDSP